MTWRGPPGAFCLWMAIPVPIALRSMEVAFVASDLIGEDAIRLTYVPA